jgi:hypothetical protein
MQVKSATSESPAPRPLFLKRAHWLDLALALSDRSRTSGECARYLGVDVSLIYRPLLKMTERGLLEANPWPAVRGTHYRLREELVERAEEEARAEQRQGTIVPAQIVLRVEVERLLDLANALSASDLTRSVVWVAKLDAGNGFLLVLDGRNTSALGADRLRGAIEASGGSCSAGRVEEVLDPVAWRRQLAAIRDASL